MSADQSHNGSGRGLFVTFEGGEGSGKSTQSALLALHLETKGRPLLRLREPGGTPLGEELRRTLLQRSIDFSPLTEALLFLAARAELVRTQIRPALEGGSIVICDRFTDSTLAYQGYGRGLDIEQLKTLNHFATGGLRAALTVLLDLPVDAGRARKGDEDDAFHREERPFHERVRQGYLSLAREDPERWLVLDGTRPPHELALEIAARVETLAPPTPAP